MKRNALTLRSLVPAVIAAAAGSALAQAPDNDNFSGAAPLTAGVLTAGTNVNATAEAGEPPTHWTATYAGGVATGKSVWYSYISPDNGYVSFSVVAQGTGTTAAALQAAAYSGTALNDLVRISSASSTAGGTGTAGVAYPSNLFPVTAGVPVYIQVTGTSATGVTPFDITLTPFGRSGSVVLPRYSNWEWLHPTTGADPTISALWPTTWKIPGDPSDYGVAPAVAKFSAPQPAPLGFNAFDGAPGVKSDIGTAAAGANNNAGYARTTFTLAADSSNLWAEVVADDGAYLYIDDFPGIPVHIGARLADNSTTTSAGFYDYRPQPDVFLTGAIPTTASGPVPGCRAYAPTGFNAERNTKMVFLSGLVGKLSAGPHRIAVSLHQTGTSSSDMAFDMQILDMSPRPLVAGSASISFTSVPVNLTISSAALEHHWASGPGQTDIAWYCAAPASSLTQGCVTSDVSSGSQNALRFNAASGQRFVTEPVSVDGLPFFVASLKIRTNDTSSGFEAADGFRVFLETSDDGVNFSEPAVPLDIQPQLNDDEAYLPFKDGFVTRSVSVAPNAHRFVRMVITGGTDSGSESIYFDDITFSQCQIFPAVSNVVYNNNGDNDRTNDTVSFNLTVTGSGTTGPTWTTTGFGAGGEITGAIDGGPVLISRPATDASGARQNVVFSVADDGNPACTANVTVIPPAAAIGTISLTNPVRSPGADPSTTADDTFTYTVLVDGIATGVDYEIRSSDAGNTVLYGTGVYGTPGTLTISATVPSITIRDNSLTTLLKTAILPPPGADLAIGRTILSGVNHILYSNPLATAVNSRWMQASGTGITPAPGDLGLTVSETTTELHPAAVFTDPDEGVIESTAVDVTGLTDVVVSATLLAYENSTGSGFEATDTFKIEVIEDRGAGDNTINLISGLAADDSPVNNLLNGFTGSVADPYDNDPTRDEFNLSGALVAGNARGVFQFSYPVPSDVVRVRVRVTGANDSASEYFFLQDLVISNETNADTDSDGLADSWENANFGNLAQNGSGDPDGDGQTNAAEQAAGTLPTDGSSALHITASAIAGNLVDVTFQSVAGKKYRAQTATGLSGWTDTGSEVTAAGPETTISGLPAGAGTQQFFRVKLVTP